MRRKKWSILIFSFFFFVLGASSILLYFYVEKFYKIDISNDIRVINKDDETALSIENLHDIDKCGYSTDNGIKWVNINNKNCTFEANENTRKVYIKKFMFIRSFEINDLVIKDNLPKKIFIAMHDEIKLNPQVHIIGDKKEIKYESLDNSIVTINNDKIVSKKVGSTKVKMTVNNKYEKTVDVEVTDLIVKRPKKFDDYKKNLKCEYYSKSEAEKLDKILENRIENVGGYGTRAAVVEAIRFLMLDFPYQIEYFFENGRIDGGMHNADGEGRYYHKGLYLHEDKFKTIKYSFAGPAIWGCPLRNYEDWGKIFKKGQFKPNGLDCSGFVSWCILNGGFDVGDKGAGDNLEDTNEINDIGGEKVKITDEFVKSGKLKAGDLVGIWGHIAIVAGIDKDSVYVAESLWTFGGPVINTYKKDKLDDKFVQAVLLDDVYKKDGLYTEMW